jgi:UPF0755 protein
MSPRAAGRLFALLSVVFAAVLVAWLAGRWYVHDRPLPLAADIVVFRVTPGMSVRGIAQAARAAGVGVHVDAMVVVARVGGTAKSLRAGRYAIERGTSLGQLLAKLQSGDVLRERLTIVEGVTFNDMRALLAANPDLKIEAARLPPDKLLALLGAEQSHPEGLFAPETYLFEPGTSDLEILRQAYQMQMKLLADAWERRAAGLPYRTPYEALIMASIIEKETGQSAERALIAGVFVNRLRLGMLLQTDPTIIYGLGARFDGNLRKRDLVTDGPYNTYTRPGLPPTPIALPGRASIEAALQPAPTPALYFVARGDGTSQFSTNLADHNRAVDKYQRGIR